MAENETESQIPSEGSSQSINPKRAKKEDGNSDWLTALATYIKETQTDILDLANRGLKIEQVQFILNFLAGSEFTELNLTSNCLTNGVAFLAPFLISSKIKRLNVSWCSFTKEDLMQLAEVLKDSEITDLTVWGKPEGEKFGSEDGLEFVSLLQKSKLTTLSLKYFYFFPKSEITSLLQEFLKLPVTFFDFNWCHFDSKNCISIFTYLKGSSVTEINLDRVQLSDEAFRELCRLLKEPRIKKLNLRRNNLQDNQLRTLIDGLVSSQVTDLDIMHNSFSNFDLLFAKLKETRIRTLGLGSCWNYRYENLIYPDSLRYSSLVSLDFRACQLSDAAGAGLMENLRFSNVEKLNVSQNYLDFLTIEKFTEDAKAIHLTDIDISHNPLSREAFLLLEKHLKDSKLTCIKLCGVGSHTDTIGSQLEATDLFAFLQATEGSTISQIEMKDNRCISDRPPVCDPKLLMSTTFTELHLSGCEIRDKLPNLISHLKYTAVTHLNLANNLITDGSVTVLADSLKETQIRKLNLSFNAITSKGAEALARSLKKSNLLYLHLTENPIEEDGLIWLAEHAKDTFISELDAHHRRKEIVLFFGQILWQNKMKIHKLVSIYKQIAPAVNDDEFHFDRNSDDFDVGTFLEECMSFYRTIVNDPLAINVLLEDKSVSLSREQISKLVLEGFPRQFSCFIASRIETDLTERVRILEKAEELGLIAVVESLLIHRPLYWIDEEQGILHPRVYKLLRKYKQPICNLAIEPHGVIKIIEYFTKNSDIENSQDVVKLLQETNVS